MCRFIRTLPFAVFLLLWLPSTLAQSAANPTGHWEGTIKLQDQDLKIEIDLAKNDKGNVVGTFSQPAQGVKGLPLSTIAVEGRSVRFVIRADGEPVTFAGTISEDGKSMPGSLTQSGHSMPFNPMRTGDARITAVPPSPPITKKLEGTWNGTLQAGEKQMRLILKMMNHPDGTATGTIVSPNGSGVEIAVAMKESASTLTVDIASVGASYAGVLNDDGTELVGTWTQGKTALPLTFRRSTSN